MSEQASRAGLRLERVQDLALAVSELATNAIRHGIGTGILHVWRRPDRVVCQVRDRGHILDPLVGRRLPEPHVPGGLGLWTVNQLWDLVEVRSTAAGTMMRVHTTLA